MLVDSNLLTNHDERRKKDGLVLTPRPPRAFLTGLPFGEMSDIRRTGANVVMDYPTECTFWSLPSDDVRWILSVGLFSFFLLVVLILISNERRSSSAFRYVHFKLYRNID